jgi:hypothetical protein
MKMNDHHIINEKFILYLIFATIISVFSLSCKDNPESAETGSQYGWETDNPSALGLDQNKLNAALNEAGNKGFINSLLSLDQKLMDFYPEYESYIQDMRIYNIKIKELLNMKGGINIDESIYNYVTLSPASSSSNI